MNILIAGDFCPTHRIPILLSQKKFDQIFGQVKPMIEAADYSIVNFECPITSGTERPIKKCGPHHRCSEEGMEAVKYAGFNCVTFANNHFFDFGEYGVKCSIDACKRYGIDYVGGGRDYSEASNILYKIIGDKIIAIINCCEHEFSVATNSTPGSNPLNPIQQYYKIQEAKQKADYILVIVHGGHELYQLPSRRMQETYRFFINAGADAVVNHHQHCFSGYETYQGKPIIYGLGNFCFDSKKKKSDIWHEGYMVKLFFDNDDVSFETIPYTQCKDVASITILKENDAFLNRINRINQIIVNKNRLEKEVEHYYSNCQREIKSYLQPFPGGWVGQILRKLFTLKLIPNFLSSNEMMVLLNFVDCESHRDKLLYVLKSFNNKN